MYFKAIGNLMQGVYESCARAMRKLLGSQGKAAEKLCKSLPKAPDVYVKAIGNLYLRAMQKPCKSVGKVKQKLWKSYARSF